MDKILEVNGLCKFYDNFRLEDVTFHLERGYLMGFVGPNGAGKTTTIKSILGLIHADEGTINIFGQKDEAAYKEKVGVVVGESAYYEFLAAKDMAKIISKFYRNWDDQRFKHYMNEFHLDSKQKLSAYSRGMKVKFLLACALSHHAELFILDEPTSGIDPIFRSELCDIFQDIISDGEKSILFSTHITSDLDNIADYVTFINEGHLVFSKEREEMLTQYGLVKGTGDQLMELKGRGDRLRLINSQYGFSALSDDIEYFKERYKDQYLVEDASIEDIMLHHVKGVTI